MARFGNNNGKKKKKKFPRRKEKIGKDCCRLRKMLCERSQTLPRRRQNKMREGGVATRVPREGRMVSERDSVLPRKKTVTYQAEVLNCNNKGQKGGKEILHTLKTQDDEE